jgi:hypothetical protein
MGRKKIVSQILNARFVVALVFVLLGAGAVAQAAPVDKRELEARADYAAGRYGKAVDGFAALFADTADPVYLRNIGRCYQKMKQPQQAIDSFQEYLQKAKTLSRTERREIEGYMAEMEVLKRAQAAEAPAAPPAVIAPPVTATPLPEAPPLSVAPPSLTPPVTISQPAPPPASEAGNARSWRIAGIATAARPSSPWGSPTDWRRAARPMPSASSTRRPPRATASAT